MDDKLATLKQIEIKLSALVGLAIEEAIRSSPDLARRRRRPIDAVLSDAGLTGTEIAKLLGKTPQAVSQVLQREQRGRPRGE